MTLISFDYVGAAITLSVVAVCITIGGMVSAAIIQRFPTIQGHHPDAVFAACVVVSGLIGSALGHMIAVAVR